MKTLYTLTLLLLPLSAFAQPDFETLQKQWVQTLQSGESSSDFYWEGRSFTYAEIDSSDSGSFIRLVKSQRNPGIKSYKHRRVFRHADDRYLSAGNLITDKNQLVLLTGWRNVGGNWKKEIDILLTQKSPSSQVDEKRINALDTEREKWVTLANQHNPEAHIEVSYTEDATYFGNGRKSAGRAEIADRYSYMENPNYEVDLENEQLWNISEGQVLEVGRYFTGSVRSGDGGIYVILWEKQSNGSWQIALDFNF
ncbi:MAG: nuclear transport factor 2 family protein [Gracilimonas sp.]|uniref:YybH family protein n=1 Tax=Gracilimonas sp. TaxID=1974203 RepID=UPI0019B755BF|nr:hypothetical protein [Gracilimonas sp.]MBD3617551.1 nuclear transport factor 2 family protein [Gracilimonas sp.]